MVLLKLALLITVTLAVTVNVSPSSIPAGELTPIQLNLTGSFNCPATYFLTARFRLKPGTPKATIFSAITEHSRDVKQQFIPTMDGRDPLGLNIYTPETSFDKFQFEFNYFNLIPSAEKIVNLSIACCKSDLKTCDTEILSPLALDITVTGPPTLEDVVKLTPPECRSGSITNVNLKAPWPAQCRLDSSPVIKVSLDAQSLKDGGALFSDPHPDYLIRGINNNTYEMILPAKSGNENQVGKFSALEFKKEGYALHNILDLNLKMLGQAVPAEQAKDVQLEVKFICGNSEVKVYSKEERNAPKIKVNQATSVSLALPALIVGCLICFL